MPDLTIEQLDELAAKAEKSRSLTGMRGSEKTIYIHGRDNDLFPRYLWITVKGLVRREVSDFIVACDPDTIRSLVAMARRGMR